MKKAWIILLFFLYLGNVSGMHIHVHYCCGKIKYISFFDVEEKKSCCGSKKKSKGCCHDKTAHVKTADQHKSAGGLKIPGPAFKYTDLFIQDPSLRISALGLPIKRTEVIYKPPVRNVPPLYIFNNILLI